MTGTIVPNGRWQMFLMSKYTHSFFTFFLGNAHSTASVYQQLLSFVVFVFFLLVDIDECSQSIGNMCTFQCVNIQGSYQCACPPHGYSMSPNGRTCQGKDQFSNFMNFGSIFLMNSEKHIFKKSHEHITQVMSGVVLAKITNVK